MCRTTMTGRRTTTIKTEKIAKAAAIFVFAAALVSITVLMVRDFTDLDKHEPEVLAAYVNPTS